MENLCWKVSICMMKFQQIVPSQNPTNHPKSFTLIHHFWSTKMKFWRWNYKFRSYTDIFPSVSERKKLLATFGNFKPFWQLLAIFLQLLTNFSNNWQLLATLGIFWQRFLTLSNFCHFLQHLTTVCNFWQFFVSFSNFWQLLATLGNCWQLLEIFVNFCQLLSTFVNF